MVVSFYLKTRNVRIHIIPDTLKYPWPSPFWTLLLDKKSGFIIFREMTPVFFSFDLKCRSFKSETVYGVLTILPGHSFRGTTEIFFSPLNEEPSSVGRVLWRPLFDDLVSSLLVPRLSRKVFGLHSGNRSKDQNRKSKHFGLKVLSSRNFWESPDSMMLNLESQVKRSDI